MKLNVNNAIKQVKEIYNFLASDAEIEVKIDEQFTPWRGPVPKDTLNYQKINYDEPSRDFQYHVFFENIDIILAIPNFKYSYDFLYGHDRNEAQFILDNKIDVSLATNESLSSELLFRAKSVSTPNITVETIETKFRGLTKVIPISKSSDHTFTINFEESQNCIIFKIFEQWLKIIDQTPTNADRLMTNVTVYKYKYNLEHNDKKLIYFNCFPVAISSVTYSASGDSSVSYDITFSYDYYRYEDNTFFDEHKVIFNSKDLTPQWLRYIREKAKKLKGIVDSLPTIDLPFEVNIPKSVKNTAEMFIPTKIPTSKKDIGNLTTAISNIPTSGKEIGNKKLKDKFGFSL